MSGSHIQQFTIVQEVKAMDKTSPKNQFLILEHASVSLVTMSLPFSKGWSIFAYGFYYPFNESISPTPPTHPPILS